MQSCAARHECLDAHREWSTHRVLLMSTFLTLDTEGPLARPSESSLLLGGLSAGGRPLQCWRAVTRTALPLGSAHQRMICGTRE